MKWLPDDMGPFRPVSAKASVTTAAAGANLTINFKTDPTSDSPATDVLTSDLSLGTSTARATAAQSAFAAGSYAGDSRFELRVKQVGSTAGSEGVDLSVLLEFEEIG